MANEKLMKIQTELNAPKNQRNTFGKYNYRSCEDILEGLKPLMLKYKCSITVSDIVELVGSRYYIKAIAILTDCELDGNDKYIGESTAYAREPESQKGMNEAQITGSASSYARKYALNGLFAIDDNKDADSQDNSEKKQTVQQNNYQKPTPKQEKPLTKEEKEAIELKESIKSYQINIGELLTTQESLGLNGVAIKNSIKKHLKTETLSQCKDINALSMYYLHCQNKITELKKGV